MNSPAEARTASGSLAPSPEQLGLLQEALDSVEFAAHHLRSMSVSSSLRLPPKSNHCTIWRDILPFEDAGVHFAHREADQFPSHGVAAFEFAFVFEFDLAGDRGQRSVDIEDARDGTASSPRPGPARSALEMTFSRTEMGSRCADAGALVDALVIACGEGQSAPPPRGCRAGRAARPACRALPTLPAP